MIAMPPFIEWEASVRPEINKVSDLTRQILSDEPERLVYDLRLIEGHNARIGFLLAEANSYLSCAKQVVWPKKEFGSEMDRKVKLDSEVSGCKLVCDTLENLVAAIKTRITLGQSLLKYHLLFAEINFKRPNS